MQTPIGASSTAAARAHSNIALIKYWGKRDAALNIPAVGSISLTLDALYTDTRVTFRADLSQDELWLDGRQDTAGRATARVSGLLDLVRQQAGTDVRALVESGNNFPTGAGLASSASGFAALAVAASAAAGVAPNDRDLSILARRGSGSAARSIFGGFTEMHVGERPDGSDSFAEPLLAGEEWPLSVVVAITERAAKKVGSTTGMTATASSSPFYAAWVDAAEHDLADMRHAIDARNFVRLGELAEHSCLKLHSLMLSTRPALIYWNAATMAAIHAVRMLRAGGVPVYFTIDAGPQVKAICLPEHAGTVATALDRVHGIHETRTSSLGPGAYRLD